MPPTTMPTPEINFAGLDRYESAKARASWEKVFATKKAPSVMKGIVVALGIIAAFVVVFFILFIVFAPLLFVAIVATIIWLIVYSVKQRKKLQQATAQFAADNHWQVLQTNPQMFIQSITPGNADSYGISGSTIAGQLDGCPFWLYQYEYTIRTQTTDGQGNTTTQTTTKSFHVITVQLPQPLPAFFLDSRLDGGQEAHSTLFSKQLQKLSLEGNFDDSFSLYQQPGSQIDVLSIITPEFMQALMDKGAFLNIESDGTTVHFISSYGTLLNATPTKYLFAQSSMVLERILFKLTSYHPSAPEPAAIAQQPQVVPLPTSVIPTP